MNAFNFLILIITALGNLPYDLNTVSNLEIYKYMGNWNYIYTNKITEMIVGENISCLTSQYKIMDEPFNDNFFSIEYNGIFNNTNINTYGIGHFNSSSEHPGKLIMDLVPESISFNYLILENGPIINNQYQYSIVTDDFGIFLYVLIRNIEDFTIYQKDIDRTLEFYNFTDYFRKPIILNHVNC